MAQAQKTQRVANAEEVAKDTIAFMQDLRDAAAAAAPAAGPPTRLPVTYSVVEATDTKKGIVEFAERAAGAASCGHVPRTVIVMGSRGLGAVARMWMGSCTNYVLHNCAVPLIVAH